MSNIPYDVHMGFTLTEMDDAGAALVADVDASLHNPAGVLHGGVLAGLLDSSMGLWVMRHVYPKAATNTDLQVRFLRGTIAGRITARSEVVHAGRTTCVMRSKVHNEQNQLVAMAESTFLVLDSPAPNPPIEPPNG